jgi:antitoxin CptB
MSGEADRSPVGLERRRRRALYRASHRGTKEMDWVLGRYAESALAGMDEPALRRFEELLAMPDPEINSWVLHPETLSHSQFGDLIAALRLFHRLDPSAA